MAGRRCFQVILEQSKVIIKNCHILKGTASHGLEKEGMWMGEDKKRVVVISGEKCCHGEEKCSWRKKDSKIWMWPR